VKEMENGRRKARHVNGKVRQTITALNNENNQIKMKSDWQATTKTRRAGCDDARHVHKRKLQQQTAGM
jgi:hypothetical protein